MPPGLSAKVRPNPAPYPPCHPGLLPNPEFPNSPYANEKRKEGDDKSPQTHGPTALCPLAAFLQLCSGTTFLDSQCGDSGGTSSSHSTPTNMNLKNWLELSVSLKILQGHHIIWPYQANQFPPTGCREGRKNSSLTHLSVVIRDLPVFDVPQSVIL